MTIIRLTHANVPDTIVELHVSQVFYKYYSNAHKCVHIVSLGGAFVPVKESLEQVNALMNAGQPAQPTKEGN